MAKTYTTCVGMRGERTARGGRDGCRASVQSYDGSVIVSNWYDGEDLRISVGVSEGSSSYPDHNGFVGTFAELKELLKLNEDIKSGKVSVVRHRKVR